MKKQLAASLACLLLLTGCAKAPVTEDTTPTDLETTPVTSAPTVAPETVPAETEKPVVPVNPLTGEALSAPYDGSRPYAVMINNIQVAMPQCGTSHADIMYEVLAEGGVTRMMAIFSGLEGETPLGSIRSLRPYYLSIARSYDAIMVHAGASEGAYADLSNTGWITLTASRGPTPGIITTGCSRALTMLDMSTACLLIWRMPPPTPRPWTAAFSMKRIKMRSCLPISLSREERRPAK